MLQQFEYEKTTFQWKRSNINIEVEKSEDTIQFSYYQRNDDWIDNLCGGYRVRNIRVLVYTVWKSLGEGIQRSLIEMRRCQKEHSVNF